jgi:L-arabinokinase
VVAGVDESAMYAAGLGYQDVVRAVDVVVSKPGYGIISDCVANGTALLYTARGRFAEYDVLVAEMPRHLRCRFIDGDDFRAGRWREGLDALLASPQPERPRVDGARVVAEKILESV